MAAGAVVKGEGKPNDLMERIAKHPIFAAVHDKLDTLVDPKKRIHQRHISSYHHVH
jgi:adenylosuccinate lyase